MKKPSELLAPMMDHLRVVQEKWDATRQCKRCEGSGQRPVWQWEISKMPEFKDKKEPCSNCHGQGFFARPDVPSLLDAVLAVHKGKVNIRSARPKWERTTFVSRAYYIWRIARFHGGIDVTLPVMASMDLGDDPYRPELEAVAETTAKTFCGTDMAAALRWGPLLGGCTEAQARAYEEKHPQPMTAMSSGPVVIGHKPESEQLELK